MDQADVLLLTPARAMCWKQVLVSHNLNSALSGLCRSPDIVSACANWSELLWVTVTCALCPVSVHSCFTLHLHWNFQSSLKASRYSVFGVTKNPSYDVSCTFLFFLWIVAVIAGIFIIIKLLWVILWVGYIFCFLLYLVHILCDKVWLQQTQICKEDGMDRRKWKKLIKDVVQ